MSTKMLGGPKEQEDVTAMIRQNCIVLLQCQPCSMLGGPQKSLYIARTDRLQPPCALREKRSLLNVRVPGRWASRRHIHIFHSVAQSFF